MLFVGVQDGFGVTASRVTMTGPLQVSAEVPMVEDFAVVYDPARAVLVGHGLMSSGKVDDAQPAESEVRPRVVIEAAVVGTAVVKDTGHARQGWLSLLVRCGGDKTGDATHIYPV